MNEVLTRYGQMRVIEADSVVSRSLKVYGEWAMDELNLLRQIISPGMCVLDVGAFIGTHTLAFAEFVGPQGKVHSFEPRKEIYAILTENIFINNLKNVTAFNVGLADKEGVLSLQPIDISQDINFGGLAIDSNGDPLMTDSYQIRVSTIDNLDIQKIDVVKLDVEGMEKKVLDGAIKTVLRDRPIIFCECNSLVSGSEMLDFCKSVQYDIYGLLASAYNPQNFNEVNDNFFGTAKELALVLIPRERVLEVTRKIADVNLIPIHNLEDLVLPLLFKPQYSYEVLTHTASFASLGINFPSPAVIELDGQIANLNKALTEQNKALTEQDEKIANLHQVIEAVYQSTSWYITKPLREMSRWGQRLMLAIRLFQSYRRTYPGLIGLKRLSYKCIYAIEKGGLKGLWNNVALYERVTNSPQMLIDAVNKQHDASGIAVLHQNIKNNLIVNPTIIFDHNGGGGANTYTHEIAKNIIANAESVLRIYCFDAVWFVQWINDDRLFFTTSIDELFDVLSVSGSKSLIINSIYGYPDIKLAVSKIDDLKKTLDAKLDFKIHDFYALCPSPHLSDFEEKYCGVPQDFSVCAFCLKKNLNWYHPWFPKENRPIDIIEWRKPFINLFETSTEITFFDRSSVEIVRKAFQLEDNRVKVIPHVTNYFKCEQFLDLTGTLHIGILGTLSHIKGGHVVKKVYDYISDNNLGIPITVVGNSYLQLPTGIKIHGNYTTNDLPTIVSNHGINVILMPSIVPETFSYTISEAMEMGLPIVAFDIGAQGQRVKQYLLGEVVPLGSSPKMILTAIQNVLKTAQELKI